MGLSDYQNDWAHSTLLRIYPQSSKYTWIPSPMDLCDLETRMPETVASRA